MLCFHLSPAVCQLGWGKGSYRPVTVMFPTIHIVNLARATITSCFVVAKGGCFWSGGLCALLPLAHPIGQLGVEF